MTTISTIALIEMTTVGGDSAFYTFDLRNRLSDAEIDRTEGSHDVDADTSYEYDDAGIRVNSEETITVDSGTPYTANKVFLTDANNPSGYAQVLEERASPSSAPTMTYVIGPDVLSQTSPSATHYFGFDGIGSTRQLITSSAVVAASYSYDAYGIQITNPSTFLDVGLSNLRYTGEQFDSTLQQTYIRARFLDSNSGVFASRDSIIGSPVSPRSFHQSLYVQADPINSVDPTGNVPLPLVFAGIAGAIAFASASLDPENSWSDAAQAGVDGAIFGLLFGVTYGAALTTGGAIAANQFALSVGATVTLMFGVTSIYQDSSEGKLTKATFDATITNFGLATGALYLRGALSQAMTGRLSRATSMVETYTLSNVPIDPNRPTQSVPPGAKHAPASSQGGVYFSLKNPMEMTPAEFHAFVDNNVPVGFPKRLTVIEAPDNALRPDPHRPVYPFTRFIPPNSGAAVIAEYGITYDPWGYPTFTRID